jgi:hypothetical protein
MDQPQRRRLEIFQDLSRSVRAAGGHRTEQQRHGRGDLICGRARANQLPASGTSCTGRDAGVALAPAARRHAGKVAAGASRVLAHAETLASGRQREVDDDPGHENEVAPVAR